MVLVDGVAEVPGLDLPEIPSRAQFKNDLTNLWAICRTPEIKTASFSRLERLSASFTSYQLDHGAFERDDQAELVGDLYSVMKVDNHIHLAAAMTPRQLLHFIKNKLRAEPDREVVKGKTLRELIFEAVKDLPLPDGEPLCGDDGIIEIDKLETVLTVDSLRCCAGEHFYHRFDNFNDAYSPLGAGELRNVFLKTSNFVDGQYFAELTHEILQSLHENEMRLSIYGKNLEEWDELARLGKTERNIWMIQIPRVFGGFRKGGLVENFEELLNNIFQPLFEVALNPSSHSELAEVLPSISGFDCVDDESISDALTAHRSQLYGDALTTEHTGDVLRPQLWTIPENPPYSYYMYYLYANMQRFNNLCKVAGRPWHLTLRPHCGEAGPVHHLATSFLLADEINHGIQLEKNPTLQYLYLIAQVGMSLSPLSNNALFLKINESPFSDFFSRGLNVTLSTDDPLMFHVTKEPLLEEYTTAKHVFGLTNADLCEIAANSVRQSAFPHPVGQRNRKPVEGTMSVIGRQGSRVPYHQDPELCNVPRRRINYRNRLGSV
ncbi:unnamed protein product [Polarella glacialis]|uniref:AMP deaminase n=1 Tax=Polarella glacialis TaxID=89957 RepID=A0A813FJI9_POLGL|nr:unnamed protein product [Polarella glacialis]CAE8731939.1 unnamed protein product [Polarella glacialis]